MYNILKLEIKNCLNSYKFKINFFILSLISIFTFILTCNYYYGYNSIFVPPAYKTGFISNSAIKYGFFLFLTIMPLLVCFIYSDSYEFELKKKINTAIITRCGRKRYLLSKILTVSIVAFFSVFIIMSVTELLSFFTFANKGSFTGGSMFYDLKSSYNANIFLANIKISNPYLFNFILILINSLYAAILAAFTFSLTIILKFRSVFIIIGTTIFNLALELILARLNLYNNFSIQMYQQGGPGTLSGFFILISIWILTITIIFILGLKKDTI
ncbi:hypothetical protein H9660_14615 [Clostridium sp. Sa3CUN1]|uniref:ABC-2 family transporter protein n=1 Tax=Clostridium gallinarum TaxID=2762246 RepID=A0ABR8Q7I3_9CLOT|nr:hypothetical protein [Clostridium gallinarum]MBD7916377.1 hypothetical protein [Clostridium gallinarum]